MSEAQHSPGPWIAYANEGGAFTIHSTAGGRCVVAEINGPYTPSYDRYEADARLIAAAPDLYAACRTVLSRLTEFEMDITSRQLLATAIRRAEGPTT